MPSFQEAPTLAGRDTVFGNDLTKPPINMLHRACMHQHLLLWEWSSSHTARPQGACGSRRTRAHACSNEEQDGGALAGRDAASAAAGSQRRRSASISAGSSSINAGGSAIYGAVLTFMSATLTFTPLTSLLVYLAFFGGFADVFRGCVSCARAREARTGVACPVLSYAFATECPAYEDGVAADATQAGLWYNA
eukprot:3763778-Rhodomonas_salina.1